VGAHYDPDRLRQPLMRVGERGKEEWKAVSWDEALDFVAAKMNKIKAEHGPESMALFNHGFGQRFVQHALKSWGVINYAGLRMRSAAARATSASCSPSVPASARPNRPTSGIPIAWC